MRVASGLSVLLFSLAVQGATPAVGKDVLRKLVRLPTITFQPNWAFDPERGFTLGSADEDVTTQITALRKGLKNDAGDAEKLQQLGELYSISNDRANAHKVWEQSVEFYRERLDLQPDDPGLLAGLGGALRGADKMAEAESVLRKAVQLAPKNWHCRTALGRLLDAEARADIYGNAGRPDSSQVALARRRLGEAGENYDLAVAAAPEESEVYFRRGMHRCLRAVLLKQIRLAEGEQKEEVELANPSFSPEALDDLQHASRLSPRDYALIGGTVLFEIYTMCARKGQVNWAEFSWTSLPDKSQWSIHEALTRLENLAQAADPQLASGALEVLGILQGPVLHETRSCVTNLRRALALDASREQAAEVLVSTLAQSGRYDELLSACEERVKQKDSARNHLLLAKAYEKLKQWEDSEVEVLEALRQAPNDLTANLAYSALLLRRSQDAAALSEANNWLGRTEGLLNQLPPAQRDQRLVIDFTLTRSIYFALTDEVEAARQWAQAVIKTDGNNKLAREILSAMDY